MAGRLFQWLMLSVLVLLATIHLPARGQSLFFRTVDVEWNNEPVKVKLLHQDKNGYIWLGTSHGLFRYNGLDYQHFPVDTDTISHDKVTALHEDKQQRLWVGFDGGLVAVLKNKKLETVLHAGSSITDLLVDDNQVLWIATSGEGVFYRKNGKLRQVNTQTGLPDNYTYTLAPGPGGAVWVGTDRGIGICSLVNDKVKVQVLNTTHGLPDNIVTTLTPAATGEMWIGTQSAGFYKYTFQNRKFNKPAVSKVWNKGSITQLILQKNGLWIGTDEAGFYWYDKGSDELVSSRNQQFAQTSVTDLLPDAEGNLWIASNTSELLVTDPSVRFLTSVQGQPIDNVHAVLGADSSIWFATDKGLYRRSGIRNGEPALKHFLTDQAYKNLKIVSLYQDDWGYIWIGTFGQGAFRLNPATGYMLPVTVAKGLVNENVLSITGKGNKVWLATLGGLSLCNLTGDPAGQQPQLSFKNFTHENALGINYIYQVFIDSKERVWFATDGKGLTMLKDGQFYNYLEKEGLKSKTVYSVTEDRQGNIWFSTANAGIYRYDGKVFKNYSLKDGLRDLNITALKTDSKGHLLIMHQQGIDVLHTQSGKVLHLGEEHGITEPDAGLNAVSAGKDGSIWFGTQNGLVSYNPAFAAEQYQPTTRIQDVQVFFQSVLGTGQHEFDHDQNHLTFDYAGLWYENPEDVTYHVKLEGYDRVWTNSRNHLITYPNLPPGKYVFKVSSAVGTDFTNAPVQEYAFSIDPPFWRTYWFYALALIAVILGLYLFIKAREIRLRKAERLEKDKVMFQFETLKSQVNPHFLFNSFNTLISTIEEDPDAAVEYVEKLSDFFREMLVHREKDVISLQEELDLIRNYYFLQQKRYGSNLIVNISVDRNVLDMQVAPLTLQLLLENAIKHNIISKAKPLTIDIYLENTAIIVRNNLQPKQTQEASTKVGLQNIRSRYLILSKREIEIEQTQTYYLVRIPLLKSAANERIAY